jgi:hypothetical protein
MTETGDEGIRERLSSRGEDALGEFAQALLDNPLFKQALEVAFEARDRASQAGASAMRNLNVPTSADLDRFNRRLRAVSERLERVEDRLDEIGAELAAIRRDQGSQQNPRAQL